jgi:hypothetical protein
MLEEGLYRCRRTNYLSANPVRTYVLRYQIINSFNDYNRKPEPDWNYLEILVK